MQIYTLAYGYFDWAIFQAHRLFVLSQVLLCSFISSFVAQFDRDGHDNNGNGKCSHDQDQTDDETDDGRVETQNDFSCFSFKELRNCLTIRLFYSSTTKNRSTRKKNFNYIPNGGSVALNRGSIE